MRGKPRTPEEIAHLLAGFLGKPDHEEVIHAALREAVAARDAEWWEKLALVDNVAPTPDAVKAWLLHLARYEQKEAVAVERRAVREIVDSDWCRVPWGQPPCSDAHDHCHRVREILAALAAREGKEG
jgi:hypothetical protein